MAKKTTAKKTAKKATKKTAAKAPAKAAPKAFSGPARTLTDEEARQRDWCTGRDRPWTDPRQAG